METKTECYLILKWGTLKSWNFTSSEKGGDLLNEYSELGSSMSAMMQNDTPRQKEIICELIDLCDGDTIYLDCSPNGKMDSSKRICLAASAFTGVADPFDFSESGR